MTKKDTTTKIQILPLLVIAIVGGCSAIYFYLSTFCGADTTNCELTAKLEQWGQTGDFFGGILNPFFTFLGLIFVGITIMQNQQALKQSETELQLSREELRKSSEALQSQVKTVERQRFETTFFQLLTLFNDVVKDIYFTDEIRSRHFITDLYTENFQKNHLMGQESLEIETLNEVYNAFYNGYGYLLSGYFRTLYNALYFVDNSEFSLPEKQFYSNLVRAQLSMYELSLLFYVCLLTSEYKYENLLVLVKKYKLLEYLDDNSLANPVHRKLMEQITE
ncbi:MAG: hypothetical protein NTV43_15365 [Methylococcales bacterium]|nr:hypothetical protein [Methylococcales bacterium]